MLLFFVFMIMLVPVRSGASDAQRTHKQARMPSSSGLLYYFSPTLSSHLTFPPPPTLLYGVADGQGMHIAVRRCRAVSWLPARRAVAAFCSWCGCVRSAPSLPMVVHGVLHRTQLPACHHPPSPLHLSAACWLP